MEVDQQNQLQEMVMLSPIIHSAISMVAVITLMEVVILLTVASSSDLGMGTGDFTISVVG